MISFKEYIEEGAQEDFAKMISQHPKEKHAAFKKHYNKMRAKGMMPVTALQYTHNLMKEEAELEEMITDRYAVVDANNRSHFISPDESAALRVAKQKGLEVRKIFAPKPKNMKNAIQLKKEVSGS